MLKYTDKIRDPIHGFIYLTKVEKELIDSAPFRRLRNIRQLAFTYYVYPGAEHSRFGHSLGVMEFSSKIFDALLMKESDKKLIQERLKWVTQDDIDRNRQLLRLASLLHDIGHAPFSHASEELFSGDLTHERITHQIILGPEISGIINNYKSQSGIDANNVAEFFIKDTLEPSIIFLKSIFDGDIDSDKMDYLLRDSLFAGVHYGKYDYDRLIACICPIEAPVGGGNPVIAIEEGGEHALEALILARYFMFTQVYFHRVRRAYDFHLIEFLKEEIGNYPENIDDFLKYDDKYVMDMMTNKPDNSHGLIILNRLHYKKAFQTGTHARGEEFTRFKWLRKEIEGKFEISKIFFDEAKKEPHSFRKFEFYIKLLDGQIEEMIKRSEISKTLKPIIQFRVYADRDIREEVQEFCTSFWRDNSVS